MRLIGTVDNAKHAGILSAWLTAEGIENQIESDLKVWIKSEDQVETAKSKMAEFQLNPDNARFLEARSKVQQIQSEQRQRVKAYERNVVSVHHHRATGRTPLTITLIVISALVALFTNFGKDLESPWFRQLCFSHVDLSKQTIDLAKIDLTSNQLKLHSLAQGEFWRSITPIFVHFGVTHVVFNMIYLFQLGRAVELRYGTFLLGLFVIFSAVISNIAQVISPWDVMKMGLYNNHMVLQFGGMSGVVYALFGFVWIKSVIDRSSRFQMMPSTVTVMLGWMIFCMLPGSDKVLGFHVANWAHGMGLACGVVVAFLFSGSRVTKA